MMAKHYAYTVKATVLNQLFLNVTLTQINIVDGVKKPKGVKGGVGVGAGVVNFDPSGTFPINFSFF